MHSTLYNLEQQSIILYNIQSNGGLTEILVFIPVEIQSKPYTQNTLFPCLNISRISVCKSTKDGSAILSFLISRIRLHVRFPAWPNIFPDSRIYIKLDTSECSTRYPVSGRIFGMISGFRPDIWSDILFPAGYLVRYPVSGRIFGQISGFRPDITYNILYLPDIRYLAQHHGWISGTTLIFYGFWFSDKEEWILRIYNKKYNTLDGRPIVCFMNNLKLYEVKVSYFLT